MLILPYLSAKIHTLQGQCFLECGSIVEATQSLEIAIKKLGYAFPKLDMMIDLNSMVQLIKLRFKLACFVEYAFDSNDEMDSVNYIQQLAECLAQMFELYRVISFIKHAFS